MVARGAYGMAVDHTLAEMREREREREEYHLMMWNWVCVRVLGR